MKLEIAEKLAKENWSKEQMNRDAAKALVAARDGKGKNLGDLFKREDNVQEEMERIYSDPAIPPQEKQKPCELQTSSGWVQQSWAHTV